MHSSFTTAAFIENETAQCLREALLNTTSDIRTQSCVIRIDSAPGLQALRNDISLQSHGITLDFGYVKNKNSNCVVDKAIQELELEFLKLSPSGGSVTPT